MFPIASNVATGFLHVDGHDLVDESGAKFFIRGVNLGNWLNPEGYMCGMGSCNSAHLMDAAFREMVGSEATDAFWAAFKDNYVTEKDIAFIAATGANTIRLPFHWKLFDVRDYLGSNDPEEGFRRIDFAVDACRRHNLRVILDMHDCPGGQTGAQIDDSDGGYPWLYASESLQRQYADLWTRIAAHYADEPAVLGYDLMNEPVAVDFRSPAFYDALEPLQQRVGRAIRTVDTRHILVFSGPPWNWNIDFSVFSDFDFDPNMMYTCHHYSPGNPTFQTRFIEEYAAFRDRANRPMWMGEIGHNVPEWYRAATEAMERHNIGYTWWPYKLAGDRGCWRSFQLPEGWDETIRRYAESDRHSYEAMKRAMPDRGLARDLLFQYAENCKFENCRTDAAYLKAIGLRVV